jgi:hypothetical protein
LFEEWNIGGFLVWVGGLENGLFRFMIVLNIFNEI